MTGDVVCGPHLPRPDNLILIEQKDRNPGGGKEFVDLGAAGPQIRSGVSISRGLANAMCLVENQDVQTVPLSFHERVEVLENCCCPALAEAADVTQCLRECT